MAPGIRLPDLRTPASAPLYAGFLLTGVVTTLLGPILPWLTARWLLTDAQSGYLFTAQFLGSMLGVALSGTVTRRFGFRAALVFGYAVLAAGVIVLAVAVWPFALAATFTYGIGLGITIPATNLWVSDAAADRRAAALNVLNLFWGLGAILCPVFLTTFERAESNSSFLFVLAFTIVTVAVALATTPGVAAAKPPVVEHSGQTRVNLDSTALFTLGAIFFLYVGTENAIAGWIASFAQRIGTTDSSGWLLAPSFFWGALLAGRALSPVLMKAIPELKLATLGLLFAALGTLILIAASALPLIFIAAVLAGFGFASVYPIAIAQLSPAFGSSSVRVAPYMFALAGLGGATLPSTVGFVSTRFQSLRSGLIVPLTTTIVMLLLHIIAQRSAQSHSSNVPQDYERLHES
ncbi:MAG TPA: MFS transporter [Terriglobales bacterium]|nr:MFS transporter [Terriglobales bacterium]